MKYIITFVFIAICIAFITGFYFKATTETQVMGERVIGLSVLATSFILMPLFIYHRWKGKKIEDYMLSKENLDKMNKKVKGNPRKSDLEN